MDPVTIRGLIELLHLSLISEKTFVLYAYFTLVAGKATSYTDVYVATGINRKTQIIHVKLMQLLGILKTKGGGGLANVYTPKPVTPSVLLHATSQHTALQAVQLLKVSRAGWLAYSNYIREGGLNKDSTTSTSLTSTSLTSTSPRIGVAPHRESSLLGKRNVGRDLDKGKAASLVKAAKLGEDPLWSRAKVVIEKHFPKQVDVCEYWMVTKGRYDSTISLLEDETFDLGDYCLWYKDRKMATLSFSPGMFWHPSTVGQYRADAAWRGRLKTPGRRVDLYYQQPERKAAAAAELRKLRARYGKKGGAK